MDGQDITTSVMLLQLLQWVPSGFSACSRNFSPEIPSYRREQDNLFMPKMIDSRFNSVGKVGLGLFRVERLNIIQTKYLSTRTWSLRPVEIAYKSKSFMA